MGIDGLGFILTPNMGNKVPETVTWAADNGCYTDKVPFSLPRYLAWLEARRPMQARCLFVTAPDVVGDAAATWERSAPVLPQIRALGYRAALCAQNGIDPDTLDWSAFDALFVGGDDQFKLAESTYRLVAEAKRRGKWCHMGRCNSSRRLTAAALSHYDSADGTFLAFGPDVNLPRVRRWLRRLEVQPALGLFSVEAV